MPYSLNAKRMIWIFLVALATFSPQISIAQNAAMPDYYAEPGLSQNRDYVNQHANEHIDPFTGKLQLHYTDVHLPGNAGFDLNVQRSYTSIDSEIGLVGHVGIGWTLHFGRVAKNGSSRNRVGKLRAQI